MIKQNSPYKPKIDSGLVAWWPMDKSASTTVMDYGRNKFNGTYNSGIPTPVGGIALPVDAPTRGAISLVSNYITTSNSALLLPANLTWMAWVKPISMLFAYNTIMSAVAGGQGLQIFVKNTNKLACYTSTAIKDPGNITILNGAWSHVALTYVSGAQSIYVNGVLDSTATNATVLSNGGGSLQFGNDAATGSRTFNGFIDDVRVYNRILPKAEIYMIYAEAFQPLPRIETIALESRIAAAAFKPAWARQSNLPVIGGGTF